MSDALVDAEGLALRAGARTLLSGLSLRVAAGELWCVLGPNGSGKTTLLHTLAGLRAPDAGLVRWQGRPAAQWRADDAARLRGLLPQALHDAFGASALDVVLMGRHPHLSRWAWEDAADRARAAAALAAVDLDGCAARDVTSLSGGERQRVGIAALLAQDTPLLLLDEPVAHLDLRHQVTVLQHLRALVQDHRKAVLLSIHDLNLARRFATHALLLAGDGGTPVQGDVETTMSEAHLSAAFGHQVLRERAGTRTLFVAG
jgi:iron complex transport system ATP-binding protein